jgi:hypothetical protein
MGIMVSKTEVVTGDIKRINKAAGNIKKAIVTNNKHEGLSYIVWPVGDSFQLNNKSAVFLPWFKFSLKTLPREELGHE